MQGSIGALLYDSMDDYPDRRAAAPPMPAMSHQKSFSELMAERKHLMNESVCARAMLSAYALFSDGWYICS